MPSPLPIHVINLDRRPERLDDMRNRLGELGLDLNRIPAIDGRAEGEIAFVGPETGPIGGMSRVTRACAASHVRAWRAVRDGDPPYGVVLEDDVVLHPAFADLVRDPSWVPQGEGLVKLEKYNAQRSSTLLLGSPLLTLPVVGALRRMYSRHTGGAAYLMSRETAAHLCAMEGRIDLPVDHFLFNENASHALGRDLRPLIFERPPVRQQRAEGGSDIAAPEAKDWTRSARRAVSEIRLLPGQLARLATGRAALVEVRAA